MQKIIINKSNILSFVETHKEAEDIIKKYYDDEYEYLKQCKDFLDNHPRYKDFGFEFAFDSKPKSPLNFQCSLKIVYPEKWWIPFDEESHLPYDEENGYYFNKKDGLSIFNKEIKKFKCGSMCSITGRSIMSQNIHIRIIPSVLKNIKAERKANNRNLWKWKK